MAEPDILTRMQMFITGEVLLSVPETRALCRDAAAMLEESYAKSSYRPDMEGLKRLALLHYLGKEPPVKPIRPPARNLRAIGWRRACAAGNATTR
jgi:hypothetical protein